MDIVAKIRAISRALVEWLIGPLASRFRAVVVGLIVGAAVYAGANYLYNNVPLFPTDNSSEITQQLEGAGARVVDVVESDSNLVVVTSDSTMLSFDFCLADELGEPPTIRVYRRSTGLIPRILDRIFQRERDNHFELIYELEFENPKPMYPIFVADDVRFADEEQTVLSLLLSSYSCGSAGNKYLGFYEVDDRKVSFLGPGSAKAFVLREPDRPESVVAPRDGIFANVGRDLEFATYSIEDAVFYGDVNSDGSNELVQAFMLWAREDECHWCPHRWLISVLEYSPAGPRSSPEICRGATMVSAETYTPQEMNGFIPGSIGLFGLVSPVNLQSRNRFTEGSTGIVRSIIRREGACEEWEKYTESLPPLLNFTRVPADEFDVATWTGNGDFFPD